MKFFADTADTAEIRLMADTGLLDGVTTNPSLIHKSGRDFVEVIREICTLTDGPVSAEVVAPDVEGMLEQARHLAAIADNVIVKVPMTKEGVSAGARLVEEGIGINVTLVFSAAQAILAAKVTLSRFHRYWAKPERLSDVVREHLAIVDALDRGDAAAAEEALVSHLDMVFVAFEQLPEDERQHLTT